MRRKDELKSTWSYFNNWLRFLDHQGENVLRVVATPTFGELGLWNACAKCKKIKAHNFERALRGHYTKSTPHRLTRKNTKFQWSIWSLLGNILNAFLVSIDSESMKI